MYVQPNDIRLSVGRDITKAAIESPKQKNDSERSLSSKNDSATRTFDMVIPEDHPVLTATRTAERASLRCELFNDRRGGLLSYSRNRENILLRERGFYYMDSAKAIVAVPEAPSKPTKVRTAERATIQCRLFNSTCCVVVVLSPCTVPTMFESTH